VSDHKWTDSVLTRIIVDWQIVVFYITDQSVPVLVQIGKRLAQFGLWRDPRQSGVEPGAHFVQHDLALILAHNE
jgi:hypothetical protein